VLVPELTLRRLLAQLDLFLKAELALGAAEPSHLDKLREQRQRVRVLLEDLERGKDEAGSRQAAARRGLFDTAYEVLERSDVHMALALPEADQELRERCRGRTTLFAVQAPNSGGSGAKVGGAKRDRHALASADFHLALAGLPVQLRDLLLKLPPATTSAGPDVDYFLRHMKTVTLPPRPAVEEEASQSEAKGEAWLDLQDDDDALAAAQSDLRFEERDDVFRQRQRLRAM
jgi:hypothetical protein